MNTIHILFSNVKSLVCQSKNLNVFNFSFAVQSVLYNLYCSDAVQVPLFKFLSYGTSIYSFFMFSSEMGKSFSENFSFAENFAFLYLFSLNFALIRFTKKCINIAKICDNSRFFSEISLSCLNFAFFARQNNAKFVFDNIKNT